MPTRASARLQANLIQRSLYSSLINCLRSGCVRNAPLITTRIVYAAGAALASSAVAKNSPFFALQNSESGQVAESAAPVGTAMRDK